MKQPGNSDTNHWVVWECRFDFRIKFSLGLLSGQTEAWYGKSLQKHYILYSLLALCARNADETHAKAPPNLYTNFCSGH